MKYALLLFALPLAAQVTQGRDPVAPKGTTIRAKAQDYAKHAEIPGGGAIGAEYLVRSFGSGGQMYEARNFLVVEVAVFPKDEVVVSTERFVLQVNGKQYQITAQPPQFAAASLRYDDWDSRPTSTVYAGAGNGGVILGGPGRDERFPGSRRDRLPEPPRAPDVDHGVQVERQDPSTVAVEQALPEGRTSKPRSGFLFFAFKDKIKKVKTLKLVYTGGPSPVEIPLL